MHVCCPTKHLFWARKQVPGQHLLIRLERIYATQPRDARTERSLPLLAGPA